jgi:hypothetical protein
MAGCGSNPKWVGERAGALSPRSRHELLVQDPFLEVVGRVEQQG